MASEKQVEDAIEKLRKAIDEGACDTELFSQEQSIDIYVELSDHCHMMIRSIQDDIDRKAGDDDALDA